MDLFSRTTTLPHRHNFIHLSGNLSYAALVSRGLYLAVIVGVIMILAIGSLVAVQLRPYTAPPGKSLSGQSNQPRLVDIGCHIQNNAMLGEGGDDDGWII
jgi:hypothetical protein